jgi:branched-chain amino acid transport system permease protein
MAASVDPLHAVAHRGAARLRALRSVAVLCGLTALLAVSPALIGSYNQSLVIEGFTFALLAISVDLLWGYAGILSFGQSAFFGIGGYAAGIAFAHIAAGPAGLAIALGAGVAVAALVALAVGSFVFYANTKLPVYYIAAVTLAIAVVLEQLVLGGGALTGASSGLTGLEGVDLSGADWYRAIGSLLLVVGALVWILVHSDAGIVLTAIRDNEERSRYLGIDAALIKTCLFVVAGVVAALAGIAYVAYTANIAPSLVGFVLATNAVVWTAVGGRGTLIGPIASAILLNVLGASLNTEYPFYWQLFLGALFVAVILLLPDGVFPSLWRFADRIRRRGSRRPRRKGYRLREQPAAAVGAAPSVAALELRAVDKRFGSLQVLREIEFSVHAGECVCIVGPNGAGKTTLVRCISDGRERTAGAVDVLGKSVERLAPHRLVALGIGRKFQAANVFETLTVAESLQLASWRGRIPSVWRKSRTVDLPDTALEVVRTAGLIEHLDERVGTLGHGQKQALELAMVLALCPTVLLLDEPTAGLTEAERASVAKLLNRLSARGDIAVVLIEHDFEFLQDVATRMIVVHEGRLLLDGTAEEAGASEVVRDIYLGRAPVAAS